MRSKIFKLLRIHEPVAGLEIAATAIRYVLREGSSWQSYSVAVPAGVFSGQTIINSVALLELFKKLHALVVPAQSSTRLNVVVSFSSFPVYSQVIRLPYLESEELESALSLNLQMIIPSDSSVYTSTQPLSADPAAGSREYLASFLDRSVVDSFGTILLSAGFLPLAVEFKGLSFSRLLRTYAASYDPAGSYIVFLVDDAGVDVVVVQRGQLYFDFFTSWREIAGESRALTPQLFQEGFRRIGLQIFNYYNQRFSSTPARVLVSGGRIGPQVQSLLRSAFGVESVSLELVPKSIGNLDSSWFIACGAGIRGALFARRDPEINLVGSDVSQQFRFQQILRFFSVWRVVTPAILFLVLLAGVWLDWYAVRERSHIDTVFASQTDNSVLAELSFFERRVSDFNVLVGIIRSLQNSSLPVSPSLWTLNHIAADSHLTVTELDYNPASGAVALSALAASEEQVISFKRLLEADPRFSQIVLPVTAIRPVDQRVSFSVSFAIKP